MNSERILTYCQNCGRVTDSINPKLINGELVSECKICRGIKHNTHIGYGLFNKILNSGYLPELHIYDEGDDGKFQRANFVGQPGPQ